MARAQHKLQELSVSLGVALLMISALGANAAEPREETGFGSNPGNLRMFSYVPANQEPAAPLIVVLHGCKQKATTFASDAGWLALADRSRLALLLPEQKGVPSYFYDVYLFPLVRGAVGRQQPERLLQLVPAGGHGARSRRGAVDPADD